MKIYVIISVIIIRRCVPLRSCKLPGNDMADDMEGREGERCKYFSMYIYISADLFQSESVLHHIVIN